MICLTILWEKLRLGKFREQNINCGTTMTLVFMIIDYCLAFSFIVVYSCRTLIKFLFDDLKDELKFIIFCRLDLIVITHTRHIYLP